MNAFGLEPFSRALFAIHGPIRAPRGPDCHTHELPEHVRIISVDVRKNGSSLWFVAQRYVKEFGPVPGTFRYTLIGRSLKFLPRLRKGDEARVIYEPVT